MNGNPPGNVPPESRTPTRIAIFIPSLRGGGVERNMLNLSRGMADAGCDVDLVLARAEGPFLAMTDPRVRVVDLGRSRVLAALPGLVRYLKQTRPSALLAGMGHANLVAVAASGLARVGNRLVVSVHTLPSLIARMSNAPLPRAVPLLSRWLYPRADAVVAVSAGVAADLVEVVGLDGELVKVIPNPVVTPELLADLDLRADHPFFGGGKAPVVLGIGRLSREKGFDILLRAFALLLESTDARLLILGEGQERPALEALAARLGIADRVDLPGFVEALPGYIAGAAVVALPSRVEGFGNALVEAMAGGVPVVATDCPGGPVDILDGGKYGTLVKTDDPRALAAGIADTLRNPVAEAVLKTRAGEYALDRVVARYLEVLGAGPNGH